MRSAVEVAALAPLFLYPDDPEKQMLYTATFDLAPLCSPYAGVHLFGDQSAGRARLMMGLREMYSRRGLVVDERELPDHLGVLLSAAPALEEDEWEELRALVVRPALMKMNGILNGTENPYRHVVTTALSLTEGNPR